MLLENTDTVPAITYRSDVRHHAARIGALSRDRRPDDPELVDARRDLRAARLADHIKRTVDAAPRLTPEQRDRLALLLRTGGDSA